MGNERDEIIEKFAQLNLLVQNLYKQRKFGDRSEEFRLIFNEFRANMLFFLQQSYIGIRSEPIVNEKIISHLTNSIKNLEDMKEIAQEYKQNNLVGFINSIITYLNEIKQRLIRLVK